MALQAAATNNCPSTRKHWRGHETVGHNQSTTLHKLCTRPYGYEKRRLEKLLSISNQMLRTVTNDLFLNAFVPKSLLSFMVGTQEARRAIPALSSKKKNMTKRRCTPTPVLSSMCFLVSATVRACLANNNLHVTAVGRYSFLALPRRCFDSLASNPCVGVWNRAIMRA